MRIKNLIKQLHKAFAITGDKDVTFNGEDGRVANIDKVIIIKNTVYLTDNKDN